MAARGDPYDLLLVSRSATDAEIRRSYQALARKFHPDKLGYGVSDAEREAATDRFQKISWAYELLSSAESRKEYDTSAAACEVTQMWPLSGTVDLDSMDYSPETGTYSTHCRCGGSYSLAESEMEEAAVDTVCCSTCSLAIRVLYQQVLEPAEGQEVVEDEESERSL
jgi:diphthamide biosynthesis protein 4